MAASEATAIVVTYNNESTIERCLGSLARAARASQQGWSAVIVDNASSDRTLEIAGSFDRLPLTAFGNTRNVGFAAAVNQAARSCDSSHLLLLNPDCYVGPDSLLVVDRWLRDHPGDAVVVPERSESGADVPSAGSMPLPSRVISRRLRRRAVGEFLNESGRRQSEPRTVEWAHLSFLYVERSTFQRLGGLDERFFLYGEDLDFAIRLRRQGGRLWWLPEGAVVHTGGHSASRQHRDDEYVAPTLRVLRIHGMRWQAALLRAAYPPLMGARACRLAVAGQRDAARRKARVALGLLAGRPPEIR